MKDWTSAQELHLAALVQAGHSAGQCAAAMGITLGMVNGKRHRLGLRSKGDKDGGQKRRAAQRREESPPMPKPRKNPVHSPGASATAIAAKVEGIRRGETVMRLGAVPETDDDGAGCRGFVSASSMSRCCAPKHRGDYCEAHWTAYHTGEMVLTGKSINHLARL